MQCRECGFTVGTTAMYCPACGARQEPDLEKPVVTVPPGVTLATPPAPKETAVRQAQSVDIAVPARDIPKPSLPQAGETFAGRYRIEKFLGQGSLCNTFLARDLGSGNREVVLKIMHPRKAVEPGLAESFLFLAESVARYDHKGIAKVFEAGNQAGAPYYTMEWVTGVPLRMWLLERLTFENRVLPGVGLIRSLLGIFAAIHERGCYGSLKTENVFITLNGPVVMDFGVVGFLSPQEFEFNSYARRYLPYMAPEIRQDWSNLIPLSDYYSLGAILYEILVGQPPMPQLKLPSEMSDLFGIETDEIVLKAMASRPLDRFGTLEAFHQAVDSLQAMLLQARPHPSGAAAHSREDSFEPGPGESQAFHSHLLATSDAHTVHNPDETFANLEFGEADSQAMAQANQGNPWALEPRDEGGPSPENGEAPPLTPDQQTISAFAEQSSRESEQAHSQRRFAHPQARPETARNTEASPAYANMRETDELTLAESWESMPGSPPARFDEIKAAPVPAWLWIVLALAGSSMVVFSAYLGLFLPR